MTKIYGHFINGEAYLGNCGDFADVFNPTKGEVIANVALASVDVVEKAVKSAEEVFPIWSALNPQKRARIMAKFQVLLEAHKDELAKLISQEHGKTIADSHGDVQRGIEVIEFACGIPHLTKGEFTSEAGTGIDVYSMRQPLGVVAGITPFNFPAMIPMWMFGIAIACGNTFIIKPSEKDPAVPLRLAELFLEAGGPPGVLNVVNGNKVAVDALIENPKVRAISFVGSSDVAHYIYEQSARYGKRVQAFGGAKNHMIVLPDADIENAANQLIGAAYGSAGERCMALPVVVPVGDSTADKLIEALIPKVMSLKIGSPFSDTADIGPLISSQHKETVLRYINLAVEEGQSLVVDGRDFSCPENSTGYFLGGTLLDHVKPEHTTYQEEIFGPVLQVLRVKSFEEALLLPSQHQYGNGVSIFTNNGAMASEFARRVNVGMVGINIPIPVPVSYHTFGGWKRSSFGDTNQYGPEGVRFWTKVKTVTQRWPQKAQIPDFNIPTL